MSLEILCLAEDGKPKTLKLPLYDGLRLGRTQLGDKRIFDDVFCSIHLVRIIHLVR